MKNIKPNYFDTPNERRTRGDNFVNIISYILGFKKVLKKARELDDKYQNLKPEDDIYNQQEDE